jgi:hypothetical protein
MVRRTIVTLLALATLIAASPLPQAEALLLCAAVDPGTGGPRENALVRLRSVCRTRPDGSPLEVSIGSTEQLAAIATLGGRLNTVSPQWPNGFTWARWTSREDGTVFDRITGLQWERKTDDGSIHDEDALYTWSTGSPWLPDGTAFTSFLEALNTAPCFAGFCDWRLPTIDELQSLNEAPSGGCGDESDPCLEIPGGSGEHAGYWSTTDGVTNAPNEINAWWPSLRGTFGTEKNGVGFVRAVRGGASPVAGVAAPAPSSDPPTHARGKRVSAQ